MKTYSILLPLLLASLAHSDYRGEVSVSSTRIENYNQFESSTDDGYAVNLSLFMRPFGHENVIPHDEVLFSERIGVIELFAGRSDQDNRIIQLPNRITQYDGNEEEYSVLVQHRAASSPHVFKLALGRWEVDGETNDVIAGEPEVRRSREVFSDVGIGYAYYIEDHLTVGIDADWSEVLGAEIWTFRASARQLVTLPNETWISIEGGVEWSDLEIPSSGEYNLKTTYYFSPRTGFFLEGEKLEIGERIGAGLSHYFRDNFSMDWSFSKSDHGDAFRIGGRIRF